MKRKRDDVLQPVRGRLKRHPPDVKFAKDYPKLLNRFFTTIRLSCDYLRPGDHVKVIHPSGEFMATVKFTRRMWFHQIPTSTLTYDTDTLTRAEALEVLREFYPNLDNYSGVCLMGLEQDVYTYV